MSVQTQSVSCKDANEKLATELRSSRGRFLSVLEGVPETLAHVREAENSWSILDCTEHVCLGEQLMFASLEKRRPTETAPDLARDARIEVAALDRTRKGAAPEGTRPTGRYATLVEAAGAFRAARGRTIVFVENLDEDLRESTSVHPMGIFDSYQLVRIMALHCVRHALQIEEIKNGPAYRGTSHR